MLQTLSKKIYHHFPALQYKNYRLYFFGQLISFSGSWLQGVAFGWLVYQLTHSAFWLGTISAIGGLPVLILSLYGGFLVDKYNRKTLLFFTQSTSLFLALLLGILTLTHHVSLPSLLVITFLSGIANAIDNPVTQAFVVDVVGKDDLPSAVGLNATIFNTGRVLGPGIAGFLIAFIGIGNIFLINAASFLAILGSLYFIQVQHTSDTKKKENPFPAIKEGVIYSKAHPLISVLLVTAGIGAVFCFSQATMLPLISEKIFQQGSTGLGQLLSSAGLGALIGSVVVSSQSKRFSPFWFIGGGNALFISSTFAFTFANHLFLGNLFLLLSSLGLTLQFSTVYATIQKLVKEEFRGRVSSIYVLLFIGFSPLGNIFMGSTANIFGPISAIRISLLVAFAYALIVVLYLPKVRKRYKKYQMVDISEYALAKN